MTAAVVSGLALFGGNQTAQAGHGCAYGGGYSYSVPAYSYAPSYSYAAPVYSYAPTYQSAYVQPLYGYSTGISIGFGQSHHGGHGSYYGGHGGHYGGHSSHFGGYGGHFGGHHGGGHH